MKILHRLKSTTCTAAAAMALGVVLFAPGSALATPYASEITNNNGTIQFYLNEPGANVNVTFANGKSSPTFNGINTGKNLTNGLYSFVLGTNANFKIAVTKVGSGTPSLIKSVAIGTARGVDVNKNVGSPYFGRIYEANGGSGVVLFNPDLSPVYSGGPSSTAGVTTFGSTGTGTGQSPYRLSVAPDDFVWVGDASENGCAVYRIDPTFSTNQLALGPVGLIGGTTPQVSHGTIESRPLVTGSLAKGNLVLYDVDGELGPVFNSIQVYNIGAGPLPWTNAPSYTGNEVGIDYDSIYLGGNEYCGLTMATNGYIFGSTYRAGNPSTPPLVQVYDSSGVTNLWNSWEPEGTVWSSSAPGTPTSEAFQVAINGVAASQGVVDSTVTPDDAYLITIGVDNGVIVCPITNGIPDVAELFTVNPTSNTGNGRGIGCDAADNYYTASSGEGLLEEWSLGITATATTYGNATGQTNFTLVVPQTTLSITASTPTASQTGPTPGVFTLTLNAAQPTPTTVGLVLSGTAVDGTTYTLSPPVTTNFVIAPGIVSTNITVNPTPGGSLPTTTVTLTVVGSTEYALGNPNFATVSILNTGPQKLVVTSVLSPTIYKGLTNDPGYFVVSRWGDINDGGNTLYASNLVYTGSATSAEFVPSSEIMEFDPGTTSVTNAITPLIDTTSYVGTKTVTIAMAAGAGYIAGTNTGTISILDNQYPPAPVIYYDPLTSSNAVEVADWEVNSANGNQPATPIDDTINFGYDLTTNNVNNVGGSNPIGLIPLPPNGNTSALRVTVNKSSAEGSGENAGVNLYLTNLFLSGNYAVRFSMDIPEGEYASYTTEGALFGINHTSHDTNWWTGSGLIGSLTTWASDGEWYWVSVDGGAGAPFNSYSEFTGVSGANGPADTGWTLLNDYASVTYAYVFENPAPYSSSGGAGLVGNASPLIAFDTSSGYTNGWADVEVRTVNNVVTMSINKTVIFTYTNTTVWTNGYLMLGYEDPYNSVGGPDAAVYYSGLTVVSLSGGPAITSIVPSPSHTVTITFATMTSGFTPAAFTVQSAATLTSAFAPAAGVIITQISADVFQAVVPTSGPTEFYRIFEQ